MRRPDYHRARLREQIREEVAEMIAGELKDPRIGLVTVTALELSLDLRRVRVLVSVLGDASAQSKTLEGLSSATGYIRREVGRRLRLRRAPEFVFALDPGAENSARVETLLQEISEESAGEG
ncbi:MAG TPA: 30S ribosome-binding factor RbfA [Terriglobia bacterium]|nr:30S ribosome-binding factor RbfA [Terriglobia bacterium]